MRLFRKSIKASNVNHFLLEQTQMFSPIVVGLSIHKMVVYSFFFFHDVSLFSQKKQRSYKIFRINSHRTIGGRRDVGGGEQNQLQEKNDSQKGFKII